MKHKPVRVSELYKVKGNGIEKQRYCPRCGIGVFLAKHKNRWYCGKCHYTEFPKSKD